MDDDSYHYYDDDTLQTLHTAQRKNLARLATQAATYGPHAIPLDILNQMDTLKSKLIAIDAELKRRAPQPLITPHVLILGSEQQQAGTLARLLRLRGLRATLLDPGAGQTEDGGLAKALPEAASVLFYGDAALFQLEAALQDAVRTIAAHLHQDPKLQLFLILNGVDRQQALRLFQSCQINPANLTIYRLDAATDPRALAASCKQIAICLLQPIFKRLAPRQAVEIDVFSVAKPNYLAPGLLQIDCQELDLGHAEAWAELEQALRDLQELVPSGHPLAIRHANTRLSIGYLVGFTFRQAANIQLMIAPPSNNAGPDAPWWLTTSAPQGAPPLIQAPSASSQAGDVLIELTIADETASGVDGLVRAASIAPGNRITLTLAGGPSRTGVKSPDHAAAIAAQVEQAIKRERQRIDDHTIHLVGALPIGLAILIATRLNNYGPIQCYEFDRQTHTYAAACRLI